MADYDKNVHNNNESNNGSDNESDDSEIIDISSDNSDQSENEEKTKVMSHRNRMKKLFPGVEEFMGSSEETGTEQSNSEESDDEDEDEDDSDLSEESQHKQDIKTIRKLGLGENIKKKTTQNYNLGNDITILDDSDEEDNIKNKTKSTIKPVLKK